MGTPLASNAGPGPRRAVAMTAIAVGVVLAVFVVLLATSPDDPDRPVGSVLIGKVAPRLDSKDLDGRPVSLDDYSGRWVLVNFFASWCAPCKVEQPELVAFSQSQRGDGGATIISVAYDDEPAGAIPQFFARYGQGDWPVIPKGDGTLALEYGVIKLPESYLIDPKGVVVKKYEGGVTAEGLTRDIQSAGGAK